MVKTVRDYAEEIARRLSLLEQTELTLRAGAKAFEPS